MIPAFVQQLGNSFNKSAGTTLAHTFTAGTTAGNLIVARILFDNAATASKPIVSSISKQAGETANWVFLGAARSTSTSAGAFASGEMWCIQTTVNWSAAAYTVTLDTSVTQKAISFQEFSGVQAVLRNTVGTAYSTTTTAASATTTGTAPSPYDLVLGFIFGSNVASAQAGDTDTSGSAWSAVSGFGSTGAGAATNNFGIGQYKVLSNLSHQTLNNSAAMTAGNGATGVSAAWDGAGNISFATAIGAGVIVDNDVNATAAIAQSKIANLTTDLGARVLKAGDTMTGPLTFSGAVGNTRYHIFQTSGVDRWKFGAGSTAESGSNAGSNFTLNRYNDAGVFIDSPMVISRLSGRATYSNGVDLNFTTIREVGEPVNTTDAATKQYTDTKVAKTGGTMTGPLVMVDGSKVFNAAGPATQTIDGTTYSGQYYDVASKHRFFVGVDNTAFKIGTFDDPGVSETSKSLQYLRASGDLSVGGKVTLGTGPANPMDAASKQYVDNRTPQVTVGTTAPSSPAVGDIWVDST